MGDVSTLRRRFPAFADATEYPESTVLAFLVDARGELDSEVWGRFYNPGVCALAAHLLELSARSAAGGAGAAGQGGVQQVRTGDEQIAYAAVGAATARADEVGLRTTPYGLEFLRIQGCVVTPYFVVI